MYSGNLDPASAVVARIRLVRMHERKWRLLGSVVVYRDHRETNKFRLEIIQGAVSRAPSFMFFDEKKRNGQGGGGPSPMFCKIEEFQKFVFLVQIDF